MPKFNSLQLKPPRNDALARSERLRAENPGYESKASARLAGKLVEGDIPDDVPHFTDKVKYKAAVQKFLDEGGTSGDIRTKVGILVGTGHDGHPTYQQMQKRGKFTMRSGRERNNTELNRQLNTNLSNPDPVSRAETDRLMQQIGSPTISADHDHSLERVGNALDPMTEERRQEYRDNFEQSGQRAGHYSDNIKPLDKITNINKETGKLVVDKDGKYSGGYSRLDKNLLKPMEAVSPSPTITQLDATGTTSGVGRQRVAMRIGRQLPGFPTVDNPFDYRMTGLGGAAGLMMDPGAMKKFAEGDYIGGLYEGAGSAALGEATSLGAQWAGPHLKRLFTKAAPQLTRLATSVLPKVAPYVVPVVKVANPVGQAVTGYQVANELVKAGTGKGFVEKVKDVQDKQKTATINAQQQQTTQQLAAKRKKTGQDQSFADKVTNVIDDNINHLEYAIKNPLSIFGIK